MLLISRIMLCSFNQSGHKNEFKLKWKKGRNWLEYDDKTQTMTCGECILAKFSNNFTFGCPSLRIDAIKSHEEKPDHKKAVLANEKLRAEAAAQEKADKEHEAKSSTIDGMLKSLNQEAIEIMTKRLKVVYQLAKNARPLSDFQKQMDLLDELKAPQVNLNAVFPDNVSYDSSVFVNEAVSAIAEWVWRQTLAKVKSSTFLGVMVDESTDNANISELILYLTGVAAGKPFVAFGDLLPIENGKALTVAKRLLTWLDESGVDVNSLSFLASDGASSMRGKHEGAG